MQELVFMPKSKNEEPFTTSDIIAEYAKVNYRSAQKTIEKHMARLEKFGRVRFEITPFETKGGLQDKKIYYLNEGQATLLVTFLKNTDVVADFKTELVRQFVAMRKLILERQTAEWQQAREQSRQVRLQETGAIKSLVEYAKAQGSQNHGMLYMAYSKLVKSLAGYDERDSASADTLIKIILFETTLFGIISEEMVAGTHYREIYAKAKQELTRLKLYWSRPMLAAN